MTISILLPEIEIIAPASKNMLAIEIGELIEEIDEKKYAIEKAIEDEVRRSSIDRMERLLRRKIYNIQKILQKNPDIQVYSDSKLYSNYNFSQNMFW